ncbi:hypothetical protein [Bacillus mobilis]
MIRIRYKKNGEDTEVYFECNFKNIIPVFTTPPVIIELIKQLFF